MPGGREKREMGDGEACNGICCIDTFHKAAMQI